MDNLSEQAAEIEALNSIYEGQWNYEPITDSYSINIKSDVKLFIVLRPDYPLNAPPDYELLAPGLSPGQKKLISEEFRNIYRDNSGSPILFQWVERLKEIVGGDVQTTSDNVDNVTSKDIMNDNTDKFIGLQATHGQTIQDRKSVFQGHACCVKSEKETKLFRQYLLENRKIANATHNIVAYRIVTPKGTVVQDCDDDGEAHAGGRVLHLLEILKLENVMVVVSRWYGGIQLGPDRFKHINNAARQVLVQGGFIKQS